MMNRIYRKKEELQAKYMKASGLQKGFTLLEMLIVVLIILVLIGIMLISLTFFGRVDGTELVAKSKSVESAVLQVALGDKNRDIPAVDGLDEGKRNSKVVTLMDVEEEEDLDKLFENKNEAEYVFNNVIENVDLGENKLENFYGLLRKVKKDSVDKMVSGDVDVDDYYVVVRKSQLYNSDAGVYANYNDELAGLVFSKKTIVDSEGKHYNGTSVVEAGLEVEVEDEE